MELLDKATEQQKLKVMLLKGTREQVFSAAKHAGIIAFDVVESDENYEKLRNVVDTMEELGGLMKQPITIPFVIEDMTESDLGKEVREKKAERIVYYTGKSFKDQPIPNSRKFDLVTSFHDITPNIETIGHRFFGGFRQYTGRPTYSQAKLAELVDELPYREVRSIQDDFLNNKEVAELWSAYMRLTECSAGDFDIAKFIHGDRKKEDLTYLGFDRGGLVVAGKVIWILPDNQYAKFHKKAADWVLPTKEYIKRVVARYFAYPDHDPEKSNIDVLKVVSGQVYSDGSVDRHLLGKFMVPVYERKPDGSYVFDKDGNRVPTGEMVEGIKITPLGAVRLPRP